MMFCAMRSFWISMRGGLPCRGLRLPACVLAALVSLKCGGITITNFAIPTPPNAPNAQFGNVNTVPLQITWGPDGAFWFTESYANYIARIDTNGNFSTYAPAGPTQAGPYGIVAGPDGNLWFTEVSANRIGVASTNGTLLTEFAIPDPGPGGAGSSGPTGITVGPDKQIWFAEKYSSRIARLTNSVSAISNVATIGAANIWTEFAPTNLAGCYPQEIITGPDGNLWYTVGNIARVGAINTNGANIQTIALPNPNSAPEDLTTNKDGSIWFTEFSPVANKIGRIVPGQTNVAEYLVPTPDAEPAGLVAGADGSIWFAEYQEESIGRLVVTTGVNASTNWSSIFSYSGATPAFLVRGPDGTIWFTDPADNVISHIIDSPLAMGAGMNFQYLAGTGFTNLVVANFQDTITSNSLPAYYTATINWGDGVSSAGTIVTNAAAGLMNDFNVTGTHTYTMPADYISSVTVINNDPSNIFGTGTAGVTNTFSITNASGLPALAISSLPGAQILITWPASTTGFQLQSNNVPTGTNWMNVTITPATIALTNPAVLVFAVTNSESGEAFYRLKR
jgi:streptogramin lyase